MITDPIADLLTRIRNGFQAQKFEVRVPYSKPKEEILKVLKSRKFIENYRVEKEGLGLRKALLIVLKYDSNQRPAIQEIHRVSKPGLRVYKKTKELKRVLWGYGIAIVSTSQGVMAAPDAKKKNLGGEVLLEVW